MTSIQSCGNIKKPGAPGILGMGVEEIRQLITQSYMKDKQPLPSLSGLNRQQLCYLLSQSNSGKVHLGNQNTTAKPSIIKSSTGTSSSEVKCELKCSLSNRKANNPNYVCNPKTGLWVKIGGSAHKKLISDGFIDSSGKPTGATCSKPTPIPTPITTPSKKIPITIKPVPTPTPITIKPVSTPAPIPVGVPTPMPIKPEEKKISNCDTLGALQNEANSCYLDSTIFSLLYKDNDFINEHILNKNVNEIKINGIPLSTYPNLLLDTKLIQGDLRTIRSEIAGGEFKTCTLLRQHLTRHETDYNKSFETKQSDGKVKVPLKVTNWLNAQLEPLDVMSRLDTIFRLPTDSSLKLLTSYGTNKLGTLIHSDLTLVTEDKRTYPYTIIVEADKLIDMGKSYQEGKLYVEPNELNLLTDLVNATTDNVFSSCNYFISSDKKHVYRRRIEESKFLKAPFLVIHINRVFDTSIFMAGGGTVKLQTQIRPVESIEMKIGPNLELTSILVHWGGAKGGHYVAYVKCDSNWYFYNDLSGKGSFLKKIGSFSQLMSLHATDITTNAVDYIYM